MAENKVVIELDLDSKTFETKVQKATNQATGKIKKNFDEAESSATASMVGIAAAIGFAVQDFIKLNDVVRLTARGMTAVGGTAKDFVDLGRSIGGVVLNANKNFFGLVENVALLGAGLATLGAVLKESDNQFTRMAGTLAVITGLIAAGLSAGVIKLVTLMGGLFFDVGSRGVQVFTNLTKTFENSEKSTLIFTRTIEGFNRAFGESVGVLDEWEATVVRVSDATGISRNELKRATAELVAAGSQYGLNRRQLEGLLEVIVDYSTITGDVFQTTVDFISGINGSAQSLVKYGIKLNESALEQFALKKGIDRSIASLEESEKQTLRLAKIQSVYTAIAGKASAISNTLAGQQQRLATNIENVNTELGRGAAIVENYNLAALALNAVIETTNDTVLNIAGFLGALGSRILQVTGLFLKWSFAIFATIKGFKLLDVFLKSNIAKQAFATSIPLINRSITQLIANLGIVNIQLSSAGGALRTFGSILVATSKNIVASVLGINAATLSFGTIMGGVFTRSIQIATIAFKGLVAAFKLLVLTPVGAAILASLAAIAGLGAALKFIEERTGIFTTLWKVLTEVLRASSSVFAPIVKFFELIGEKVATAASKIGGAVVFGIGKAVSFVADLIAKNPLDIFTEEQIENVQGASDKVKQLTADLQKAGFDYRKLGEIGRSVASDISSAVELTAEDIKLLGASQQGFWKTVSDSVGEAGNKIKLINAQLANTAKGLSSEYKTLAKEILENNARVANSLTNTFAQGAGQAFAAFGGALVSGKNALEEFGRGILAVFGDVLIQLGTQTLAVGLGMSAVPILFGFQGGAAIAAGGAMLVAGGALKALAGAGGGGGGAAAGATGNASGTPEIPINAPFPEEIGALEDEDELVTERGTEVNVNVSGIVTNPRETAQQIANLLKEGFDTNDISVARSVV